MNKRATCLLALLVLSIAAADATLAQSTGGNVQPEQPPLNDVDVSLGRQEVKQRVADHLGIKPADVPLSVQVPETIAREVCGMEELSATDATRSCTATVFTPALAEAAANTTR